ncbi:MAG TPA: nicotinate-nucleotide--dimethylbenzimidazole phosphoribosyltransferase, partial [Bryobacteraceae bacterium]|nr:nicotinate-nucleotide--dimethylbenzimidazole phosphoribosyltransferase [Bryobacteraceae bacterium]
MSLSVKNRWDSLTKPPGSLGELEQIVGRLAILRGNPMPSVHRKAVYVFAADHGVTAESVSPYPQSVTRQMLLNFVTGGAAINVSARAGGATTVVVDVGVCGDPVPGVETRKIGSGTRNFAQEAAMS